jgi:polysaccharide export outer membrane protein
MKRGIETNGKQVQTAGVFNRRGAWIGALATVLMLLLAGCQTVPEMQPSDFDALRNATTNAQTINRSTTTSPSTKPELLVLHEGDIVRVTFPGATALNAPGQTIRRDGMISIPPLGEIKVAGLTTKEAEKAILDMYGSQLQIKEVSVTLESSSFGVYVTGKVLRPGKITADRPLTVLEAVMEAGGPDYTKANLKKVTVIRTENGHTEHHILNLKKVLDGQSAEQFKLKPADIVYVPERFTWF